MPDIPLGTSDGRTAKVWEAKLVQDTQKISFFGQRFMSENQDNLVYVKKDLTKKQGDTVTIGLNLRINQGYLPSGTKVNGNENRGTTKIDTITIEDKNFGITSDDPLSMQRAFYNMLETDRKSLMIEGAENLDQEFFTALDATNTTVVYLASGDITATSTLATATAAVTVTDLLNAELITYLKAMAQTGFNRRQTPLTPLFIDGDFFWVLLTHNDALADLENDTTFLHGQRDALARGERNPLFRGAKSIWRNVIIFAHENVTIAATGGAGGAVPYVRSHFMGKNALAIAWAKMPTVEAKKPAYNNEEAGWGHFSQFGVTKLQYDSNKDGTDKDFGAITVVTARTGVSDITIS